MAYLYPQTEASAVEKECSPLLHYITFPSSFHVPTCSGWVETAGNGSPGGFGALVDELKFSRPIPHYFCQLWSSIFLSFSKSQSFLFHIFFCYSRGLMEWSTKTLRRPYTTLTLTVRYTKSDVKMCISPWQFLFQAYTRAQVYGMDDTDTSVPLFWYKLHISLKSQCDRGVRITSDVHWIANIKISLFLLHFRKPLLIKISQSDNFK